MTRTLPRVCLVLALGLGGCQVHRLTPAEPPPAGMAGYAEHLATLDASARGPALAKATERWRQAPSPTTRARLGLARGQPDYAGYDPATAVEDLEAALAAEAADWSAYDRAFLKLRAAQLRQALDRQARHNALTQENAELREQLEEAEEKLRAISEIERNLGSE